MNDHEFLTIIHHEFESNKSDKIKLEALLRQLEARFDIPELLRLGYNTTLLSSDLRALKLYHKISEELKRH